MFILLFIVTICLKVNDFIIWESLNSTKKNIILQVISFLQQAKRFINYKK